MKIRDLISKLFIGGLLGSTIFLLVYPWEKTGQEPETIVLILMVLLIAVYFFESHKSPIFWRIKEH
ncbi:MAG: hypothetical protein V3V92_06835 [Candidatus Hydrothermarchaeales archaeon]